MKNLFKGFLLIVAAVLCIGCDLQTWLEAEEEEIERCEEVARKFVGYLEKKDDSSIYSLMSPRMKTVASTERYKNQISSAFNFLKLNETNACIETTESISATTVSSDNIETTLLNKDKIKQYTSKVEIYLVVNYRSGESSATSIYRVEYLYTTMNKFSEEVGINSKIAITKLNTNEKIEIGALE